MTPEEMQEQVELMQKTLNETKSALAQKDSAIADLTKQVDTLKAKTGPTAEELEALKAKATKHDELSKTVTTLQAELTMTKLKSEFPLVDFGVVTPGDEKTMREQAVKLNAMIEAAVKKAAPAGNPGGGAGAGNTGKDPGYQFDGRGQGSPEAEKSAQEKAQKDLVEAVKRGDNKGVLDACFAGQPKATARLFDGLKSR